MGIRMSSNQFTYNYNHSLQLAYKRQTRLFENGDGGSLHRPSDDAIAYNRLLRYKDNQLENNQYQKNVDNALSWMHTSDSAMTHISDIMKTIVTKSVQAANDDNNETDWDAIAREVEAEIQEIVSTANLQEGNRFVFSGQKDLIQPFNWEKDSDGAVAVADRGLAKTLDSFQTNFFKGDGIDNIDTNSVLNQMLTLNRNGQSYYLDTQSGYVYTKEFVDEDYKELFNNGQAVVDPSVNSVGRVYNTSTQTYTTAVTVANYFTNQGIIRTTTTIDDDGNEKTTWPSISIMFNGDESVTYTSFTTIQQRIVNYAGDMKYFSMVKLNGAVQTESDTVNVNGHDLFGSDIFDNEESGNEYSGCAMVNQLLTVLSKIEAHDNHWMTSDGVTVSNVAQSSVLVSQTHLGARSQLYSNVKTMLEIQDDNITENITNVSSTDVAKLAVDLMEAQTLYSMSLSLGGRILPQSLADYL